MLPNSAVFLAQQTGTCLPTPPPEQQLLQLSVCAHLALDNATHARCELDTNSLKEGDVFTRDTTTTSASDPCELSTVSTCDVSMQGNGLAFYSPK